MTPWGPLGPWPATAVTEVILVRHGQTQANADGIIQGWIDYPLTRLGILQAEQTATALAEWPIAACYSSPMGRAQRTAAILARPRGLTVTVVPGLVEIHAGGVTGRTWEEFADIHPQAYGAYREAEDRQHRPQHKALLPGWEPIGHTVYRVWQSVGALLATAPGPRVLLVSHGDVLNLLLTQAIHGDALHGDWPYRQPNCAVSRLALDATKPHLVGGVHVYHHSPIT